MRLPWTQKNVAETAVVANTGDANEAAYWASAANAEANVLDLYAKNFDWTHYEQTNLGGNGFGAMFAGEFGAGPNGKVLKGLMLQEHWINACVNAIGRQFYNPRYVLKHVTSKDGSAQIVTRHPLLEYLQLAGREVESPSMFTANGIMELVLSGNAYWYTSQDRKDKRRLPSERVEPVIENNRIVRYQLNGKDKVTAGVGTSLQPEEVVHIKMPNPFTPHTGLSLLVATVLPVLIDKYGLEYVVGFFMRGGTTAGVIETNTTDMTQLIRFAKTIMQAFGGRKNMHADKILPAGANWKGQGSSFRDIDLQGMFKQNLTRIKASLGCTNTVLGISEDVNRATAFAELELFWRMTILPLQQMWCAGIEASAVWQQFSLDTTWHLEFDNSAVPYLDDFDAKLQQDDKLKGTWTINERRERLGKDPLKGDQYEKLELEIRPAPAGPGQLAFQGGAEKGTPVIVQPELEPSPAEVAALQMATWKSAELRIQEPKSPVIAVFNKEFGAWEQIVLDNIMSRHSATIKVQSRGAAFAKAFAEKALPSAMEAYDSQLGHVRLTKGFQTKESQQDRDAKLAALRERAEQVIQGKILKTADGNFVGYSDTAMGRVYDLIQAELEAGKSLDDVASSVRQWFSDSYQVDENYKGQASTIVRTEMGAATALAQRQFGEDLADATDEMAKYWVDMDDDHVRDSHTECAKASPLVGKSDDIIDATFPNGLRYPRESGAKADEVINCRCTVRYVPTKWKD